MKKTLQITINHTQARFKWVWVCIVRTRLYARTIVSVSMGRDTCIRLSNTADPENHRIKYNKTTEITMIEYVKGELTELTPATAVVECAGTGYLLNISLNAYSAIQGKKEVKLYVHEAIGADTYTLYGFAEKQERELFQLLLKVSGVGGSTARMIISSFTPSELAGVISSGNERMLKTVKGIGLKTAQRIIVDLKDKVNPYAGSGKSTSVAAASHSSGVMDEAVSALTMLGFHAAASQKVCSAILLENPSMPVEQVIKNALKRL